MPRGETLSEKVTRLIRTIENSQGDRCSQFRHLEFLAFLLDDDPALSDEFFPTIRNLISTCYNIRDEIVHMMLEKIALPNLEYLPETMELYIDLMQEEAPIVTGAIVLFRETFKKIALAELFCGDSTSQVVSATSSMVSLRNTICFHLQINKNEFEILDLAKEIIILCTPLHDYSLKPPPNQPHREIFKDFNIAWLSGDHPVFDGLYLYGEAKKLMDRLLYELRFPNGKSVNLSEIAYSRPVFYMQIVKVLIDFDPTSYSMETYDAFPLCGTLTEAFEFVLICTHPAAFRLLEAWRKIAGVSGYSHLRPPYIFEIFREWPSNPIAAQPTESDIEGTETLYQEDSSDETDREPSQSGLNR